MLGLQIYIYIYIYTTFVITCHVVSCAQSYVVSRAQSCELYCDPSIFLIFYNERERALSISFFDFDCYNNSSISIN